MTYAITDMLAVCAIFISHASYSDINFMCNIYIPGFKKSKVILIRIKKKKYTVYLLPITVLCSEPPKKKRKKKRKGFCKLFCVTCLSFWFPHVAAKSEYDNILQDMVLCIMACTGIKTDAFNVFWPSPTINDDVADKRALRVGKYENEIKIMTAPTLPCGSGRLVVSSYISFFPNLLTPMGTQFKHHTPLNLFTKSYFSYLLEQAYWDLEGLACCIPAPPTRFEFCA